MNQQDKDQIKALFAKYTALGFTTLDIEYSGSDDSGDLEDMTMTDAEAEDHWSWKKSSALEQHEQTIAENLAWEIIEQTGISGYENNEGGQGHIFINLATGEVAVEHENNVIVTESEFCTLELFKQENSEA